MMISPENFIDDLHGQPYERLVAEKDQLMQEIADFERSGRDEDALMNISPSPEVVYQCNLHYLAKLCDLLADSYNAQFVWNSHRS